MKNRLPLSILCLLSLTPAQQATTPPLSDSNTRHGGTCLQAASFQAASDKTTARAVVTGTFSTTLSRLCPDRPTAGRVVYKVTGYTIGFESTGKRPGQRGYGITASGKRATGRMCAADRSIPFGTKLLIAEQVWTVEDRGGEIGPGCVDLLFRSVKAAKRFGVRFLKVRVLQ